MEAQRDYPIETFDPLLRDLVCWGLSDASGGNDRGSLATRACRPAAARRIATHQPTSGWGRCLPRSSLCRLPPARTHQTPR